MNGLLELLKKHEGFRSRPYKCSQGHLTVGYGQAIKDLVLDEDIAEMILIRKVDRDTQDIIKRFPWWKSADNDVKTVVSCMVFQIGLSGFSKFKKTIDHLENKRYGKASAEMLDSKWGREQTPNRALELSNIIKNLE